MASDVVYNKVEIIERCINRINEVYENQVESQILMKKVILKQIH